MRGSQGIMGAKHVPLGIASRNCPNHILSSSCHYPSAKDLALSKLKNYCPLLTLDDTFFSECFSYGSCTLPARCDFPQSIHQFLYFFWTPATPKQTEKCWECKCLRPIDHSWASPIRAIKINMAYLLNFSSFWVHNQKKEEEIVIILSFLIHREF